MIVHLGHVQHLFLFFFLINEMDVPLCYDYRSVTFKILSKRNTSVNFFFLKCYLNPKIKICNNLLGLAKDKGVIFKSTINCWKRILFFLELFILAGTGEQKPD